ncbi:MAG TPA: hypothetical protein VH251_01110, partial [Verrucomicrobiae bacterium]|nr:hypothetical protein [Verrucomicrobiae bacterium]
NNHCWKIDNQPIAFWRKALLGFSEYCECGTGVSSVPRHWVPVIIPPEDEPAAPVRKPRVKPVTAPAAVVQAEPLSVAVAEPPKAAARRAEVPMEGDEVPPIDENEMQETDNRL